MPTTPDIDQPTSNAIAVVGNVNLDIKTTPMNPTPALFADGETSVGEIYQTIGGGAANVAVAAASLGATVQFCASVGADDLGDRLTNALISFGVTPRLARKIDSSTGMSINLNWDNHNRHFISSLPSASLLSVADVNFAALTAAGCRHFYRGDIWFAGCLLGDGNASILRRARELGMTTYVDINWDPIWSRTDTIDERSRRINLANEMLPFVDFAHGNERELSLFTGQTTARDAAAALVDLGVGSVVLHRGKAGSAVFSSDGVWTDVPAETIDRVVCETGTGDVFSAAFMIFASLPLQERLVRSNRVAADHITGRRELIPRIA